MEERLASLYRRAHCITVASGTDALLMSLMALGRPGRRSDHHRLHLRRDRRGVVLLGATPVFVDIETDTAISTPR